jgi:F-type H+-transporting ATPase subunit delta
MTNRTAALRYARALFDVALKEQADLNRIETELAAFSELFTARPDLAKVLLNPAVPAPRKRAAVAEVVVHANPHPIVGKLMVLLAERDRLVVLPDILAAYRDRMLDHQKVVRAEVTTAMPLSAEREGAIRDSLARVTGRTVNLTATVNPAIVGGMVARVGGTIYDASVTTQLQKMKQQLAERV